MIELIKESVWASKVKELLQELDKFANSLNGSMQEK